MALFRSLSAANLLALLVLTSAPHSCQTKSAAPPTPASNAVADFFSHADRQYENADQQKEIIRALNDMLTKSPKELRGQRYSDYQGVKGVWSLTELINAYFVPSQPVASWTEDSFYGDVAKPEAQDAIHKQLSGIQKEAPAH